MPAFRYKDKPLLGFAAATRHLSVFPFSPAAVDAVRGQVPDANLSKGTVRFTPADPLPPEALTNLVHARLREIS